MKQNAKTALCGMITALSTVFMLLSFFPYFTYAAPAVSGLLMMLLVIEIDCKWAFGAYVASSVLVFLLAEPESKLLYIFLFGYYPILKALLERIRKPAVEWVLKLLTFNAAALLVYGVLSFVSDISVEDFDELGKYGAYLFLGMGNLVFILYDVAISRLSTVYMARFHGRISKMFKSK